ncbi:MAG: hypothetical protein MJK15_03155 [Colwellia sp.]|nr:hypothetical protein [Colwellia sp.]
MGKQSKECAEILNQLEEPVERFTLDEGNGPLPILKFKFDGEEITYRDLVSVANQLAAFLKDLGQDFQKMTKH